MTRIVLAVVALCLAMSSAQARQHHHRGTVLVENRIVGPAVVLHGHSARPAAWCGWWMRAHVGRDPGPAFNLARMWIRFGSRAPGPAVGAIVVWSHHVGMIVARAGGKWVVRSGNDGHAVRTRARSVEGAIGFRWP